MADGPRCKRRKQPNPRRNNGQSPAGQRRGRAGAAAGPGRGPGRAVPSAQGGGRAGAKVIPPPRLAGSAAPSAPLYPLPGASLASASLLRLAVPPHSAAVRDRYTLLPPHTPRPPRRRQRARGPPAAPPPSGPGGDAEPRGERRRSGRCPLGRGSPNSETCYLRATPGGAGPLPGPAGGVAPPPARERLCRPPEFPPRSPGSGPAPRPRPALSFRGAAVGDARLPRGGTPGSTRGGGTSAAAGSDSIRTGAARPPRAGAPAPLRARSVPPLPAPPRVGARRRPAGREGCARAAGAGGEVCSLPSGFGCTCLYNNG